MSVNGITKAASQLPGYAQPGKNPGHKKTGNNHHGTGTNGVIYEPSKDVKSTATGQKYQPDAMTIARLKAETEQRKAQLIELVRQSMGGQARAQTKADGIWKMLGSGSVTVDSATNSQALMDVGSGGYWSAEGVAGRILDFAKALTGGDPAKMEEMRAAFEKGYKMAEKQWGGELPGISKVTYDTVMAGFDALAKGEGLTGPSQVTSAPTPDLFDDPRAIRDFRAHFTAGSFGESVTNALRGKAANPSLVAADLLKKLTISTNSALQVEERAAIRETAVRNAEHIARNYFSDRDEAADFIAKIREMADHDIQNELRLGQENGISDEETLGKINNAIRMLDGKTSDPRFDFINKDFESGQLTRLLKAF